MNTNTRRQTILEAANRLVEREGVAHLTIEAVAREAGLSKGGVLYHFSTKESLISGMLVFMMESFDAGISQLRQTEENAPGSWLRAYIQLSFDMEQLPGGETTSGLLAAVSTNPELLEPVRQQTKHWQELSEQDGIDPVKATLLRLAADGLWYAELLRLGAPGGELRQQVINLMIEMTKK